MASPQYSLLNAGSALDLAGERRAKPYLELGRACTRPVYFGY
ncbi:hypothetical protein [Rubrobacter aplysinae]|nr:hypothetical protein [Rubrobacter aplysinae]